MLLPRFPRLAKRNRRASVLATLALCTAGATIATVALQPDSDGPAPDGLADVATARDAEFLKGELSKGESLKTAPSKSAAASSRPRRTPSAATRTQTTFPGHVIPTASKRVPQRVAAPPGSRWVSGGGGEGIADGRFAAWRGEPVRLATTWEDTSWRNHTQLHSLSANYRNWQGELDVAVGAFVSGGSWREAARGSYDGYWRASVKQLQKLRSGRGQTFVRFAHEMNGTWYAWSVNERNVSEFRTAWARYARILRTEFPSTKLVFCANADNASDVPVAQMWPGDAYVDVVGVDLYDMYPTMDTAQRWDDVYAATTADGSPRGPEAWRAFAQRRGKPLAVPEWGVHWADAGAGGRQDNALYITKMNAFFRANAGAGPGRLRYESYFNIARGPDRDRQVWPVNRNPRASAAYQSLTWGR